MTNNWYYTDLQGTKSGPVPFETIEIMVEDGLLHSESLLWHESLDDWKHINKLENLFDKEYIKKYPGMLNQPVNTTEKPQSIQPTAVISGKSKDQSYLIISQIASRERTCGILWTILGILQILSIVGFIAGIWNIFASRENFTLSRQILERNPEIPKVFEDQSGLWIQLFVNLFLGGVVGVLLSFFGFAIRNRVLKNAQLFNG